MNIFIVLVLVDQISKYICKKNCRKKPINIWGIKLRYLENYGFAMGFLENKRYLIKIVHFLSILAIGVYTVYTPMDSYFVGLVLILSGGVSNFCDRLFRGYVVDFIQIIRSPVFNLADVYILIGVVIVFLKEIALYLCK